MRGGELGEVRGVELGEGSGIRGGRGGEGVVLGVAM